MRLKLKTWIKFCAIFGFCLLIVHYFVIGPDNRVPDEPEGNPKIRREVSLLINSLVELCLKSCFQFLAQNAIKLFPKVSIPLIAFAFYRWNHS